MAGVVSSTPTQPIFLPYLVVKYPVSDSFYCQPVGTSSVWLCCALVKSLFPSRRLSCVRANNKLGQNCNLANNNYLLVYVSKPEIMKYCHSYEFLFYCLILLVLLIIKT
jgi:hypothetical protein